MSNEDNMNIDERLKYLRRIKKRYVQAGRKEQGRLLDEMEAVTELHRKSLVRLMNESLERKPRRSQRGRAYGSEVDLKIPARGRRANVIGLIPGQIITEDLMEEVKVEDRLAVADVERDILKIAVIERHRGTGNTGLGFVRSFGLKRGAIASSVAHDSHNIIAVGTDDADMMAAARAVADMSGGLAAVENGVVRAHLPLPVAGLMSDRPLEVVREEMDELLAVAQQMGSKLPDPFMTMSFLALPVIPALKLTDKGLVDVNQFKFVPLFGD